MSDDPDKSDEKRKTRSDALRGRLSPPSESSKTAETEETAEAVEAEGADGSDSETPRGDGESEPSSASDESEGSDASESSKTDSDSESDSVRDRKNVNMYLPKRLITELDVGFDGVNRPFKLAGTPLEKNRHFRPLLLAVGYEVVREMDEAEIRERLNSDERLDGVPPADGEDDE